jgi:uncharacterized protein (TIGR02246 family)
MLIGNKVAQMKKYAFALLLAVCSMTTMATPAEEIEAVLTQQEVDWNNGDIRAYLQGYWQNEKLRYVSKGKFNYGWDNLLASYQRSYPDAASMGQLDFTVLDISLLGDKGAVVAGLWELKRAKDNPKGVFTVLIEKMDGRWQITHDHSTD